MRPQLVVRRALLATGAIAAVSSPVAATALAAGAPDAQPAAKAEGPVAHAAVVHVHHKRLSVAVGRRAVVRGTVEGVTAGQRIALQRRGGRGWQTVSRGRTGHAGAFHLRFTPRRAAAAQLRVRVAGVSKRIGRLRAFRNAFVSWYGPGLYGNKLGCGGTLTAHTIGVANKSLPCGTKLTLRYRGRSVAAKVIDRGPYVAGREFDLTAATKQALHFGSTGNIQVTVG